MNASVATRLAIEMGGDYYTRFQTCRKARFRKNATMQQRIINISFKFDRKPPLRHLKVRSKVARPHRRNLKNETYFFLYQMTLDLDQSARGKPCYGVCEPLKERRDVKNHCRQILVILNGNRAHFKQFTSK